MGKNKKKDPEKKAALQQKKEAKAEKAARKRLQKEAKQQGGGVEENVDELLELYRQKDQDQVETAVLENVDFPPPRANATLTHVIDSSGNVYFFLFGGEYYDGVENIVLDDLLRFDVKRNEWKQITTPTPRPPPRCAHSAVYYRNALYVFGGEMASADQYHHYRDLWRLDLATLTWSEIRSNVGTCPTARSGHGVVVWKNFMVVFGGFYEALRDTKWYNDVCVMDLRAHTWLDMPHSKLATRPEPRSACNFCVFGDMALVRGGFCKLKNPTTKAESKVYSDCWMLHLKPILQGRVPTWERLSVKGSGGSAFTPNQRSGTSSVSYKNRMLVFGGVVDTEQHHHKVDSIFYNDLFAFDVERRKWFPLRVKPQSEKTRRRKKKIQQQDNNVGEQEAAAAAAVVEEDSSSDFDDDDANIVGDNASGWNLDMLRSNMFAFIDGDGNIVYEKIQEEDEEDEAKEEEKEETEISSGYVADAGEATEKTAPTEESEEEKEEEKEDDDEEKEQDIARIRKESPKKAEHVDVTKHTLSSSSVMTLNRDTGAPEPVARAEPLPRINTSLAISGHSLYVYGGVLEVGDREVTLDDCWTFDLRKRDKWVCLHQGTMHKQVWRGSVFDDDDSYVSTGAGEDDDSDNELSDSELPDHENQSEKKKSKSKRAGLRQEIAELKDKLNLDDLERTPQMGEAMADFYSRTSEYWNVEAANIVKEKAEASNEIEKLSIKELKREAFSLARERYDELRPVLDRLNELDLQQQEAEEERKIRKEEKSSKRKDKARKKERRNR